MTSRPTSGGTTGSRLRRVLLLVASLAVALCWTIAAPAPARQVAAAAPAASPCSPLVKRINPAKISVSGGTKAERALVRKQLKKYAKHTSITGVTLRAKKGKQTGGVEYWINCGRLTGQTRIWVQTGRGSRWLTGAITHQIAHGNQMFVYRGTSISSVTSTFRKHFGGSGARGLLNAADCATHAVGQAKQRMTYKNNCSKRQKQLAKNLLLKGRRI